MKTPDPMEKCQRCQQVHTKCGAHNRKGKPCGKHRTPGANVCRLHGGAAPKVKAKALQRLLDGLDPAAAELVRIAVKGQNEVIRLKAIAELMDRAGLPATNRQEVTGKEGDGIEFVVNVVKPGEVASGEKP